MERQTQMTTRYNKGSAGRFYKIDEAVSDLNPKGELPSVTNILSAMAKPALVPWAAKAERQLMERLASEEWDHGVAAFKKRVKETKLACYSKLEEAADIGTAIHEAVECAIRGLPIPEMVPEAQSGFRAWERWRDHVELEVLLCEQTVYSLTYGYAGATDFTGRGLFLNSSPEPPRKQLVVGDNKSAKNLYLEHLLQIAAYRQCLREMGHYTDEVVDGLVVRIPKTIKDGTVEAFFIPSRDLDQYFKDFLAVKDVWVAMRKFENAA
jgi:hypothetical protein